MKIRFYCEGPDDRWYADLPDFIAAGGSKEACEMVCGADTWLHRLSNKWNEVILEISTEPLAEKLVKMYEDEEGGTYMAHEYKEETINHQLWLCNVTLFVFNEFPKIIYYTKLG